MSAAAMLALLLLVAPSVSCSQPLTRLQFHSIGAGGQPAAAGGGYGGYIMDGSRIHYGLTGVKQDCTTSSFIHGLFKVSLVPPSTPLVSSPP